MNLRKISILVFILLLTACTPTPQATGTLRGHVTIGPLAPVHREGEPAPTPAPEVYEARKVVVYERDGVTEMAVVHINAQGEYEVSLPVGAYVVDINHLGIDSASGLPAEIVIREGEVTILDIDIDTGIR